MDINEGRFFCRFCDRYYAEKRSLNRHISVNHNLLDRNADNEVEIIGNKLLIDNYDIRNNEQNQNVEIIVQEETANIFSE